MRIKYACTDLEGIRHVWAYADPDILYRDVSHYFGAGDGTLRVGRVGATPRFAERGVRRISVDNVPESVAAYTPHWREFIGHVGRNPSTVANLRNYAYHLGRIESAK